MRAAVGQCVHNKALSLDVEQRSVHSTGAIVSHMQIDATKLGDSLPYLHLIWSVPLQAAIAIGMLYSFLGPAGLAGLAVLKEALRICERYYPETLTRVYFYRPNFAFRAVFAIFRLWVPKATRRRFVLVREGEEASAFFGPPPHGCGLSREDAPRELGGSGPSLDGDRFLMRACGRYDREAPLPAT